MQSPYDFPVEMIHFDYGGIAAYLSGEKGQRDKGHRLSSPYVEIAKAATPFYDWLSVF